MKRKMLLLGMVLALTLGMSTVSHAAGEPTVEFTADSRLVYSNVSKEDGSNVSLGDTFEGMIAGETREQKIIIQNNNSHTVDFYMNAEALEALEEAGKSAGGAYTVRLALDGVALYDSTVGGSSGADGSYADSTKGILEVNEGALQDTVFLVTLAKGGSAELSFTVGLDGESITNDYSNALGKFGFDFLVAYNDPAGTVTVERVERKSLEPREEVIETVKNVVVAVKTGDPAAIGALAGLLVLGIIIVFAAGRKKKTEETK